VHDESRRLCWYFQTEERVGEHTGPSVEKGELGPFNRHGNPMPDAETPECGQQMLDQVDPEAAAIAQSDPQVRAVGAEMRKWHPMRTAAERDCALLPR
jgi:hypothetical protein